MRARGNQVLGLTIFLTNWAALHQEAKITFYLFGLSLFWPLLGTDNIATSGWWVGGWWAEKEAGSRMALSDQKPELLLCGFCPLIMVWYKWLVEREEEAGSCLGRRRGAAWGGGRRGGRRRRGGQRPEAIFAIYCTPNGTKGAPSQQIGRERK